MAIVQYRPRKESAMQPPNKQRRKDAPEALATMVVEVALGWCIVLSKYVTRFTAIPNVVNLSLTSIPAFRHAEMLVQGKQRGHFLNYRMGDVRDHPAY